MLIEMGETMANDLIAIVELWHCDLPAQERQDEESFVERVKEALTTPAHDPRLKDAVKRIKWLEDRLADTQ